MIIIINSANITSLLVCANSHYTAITQKFYCNTRFNKLMQSFTSFVPFNSSFWNCSYGSVSQLFYLLFIKFIEKRKKTTPLHDDYNKNSIAVTLLLSCLRCIMNTHQVLLESASLVPLFIFFNLISIFHLFSVWLIHRFHTLKKNWNARKIFWFSNQLFLV